MDRSICHQLDGPPLNLARPPALPATWQEVQLTGSLKQGTASELSDVDLLVSRLSEGPSATKAHRRDVGNRVAAELQVG